MIEKKKFSEIEKLACDITLEIRQVIDVLEMLSQHAEGVDDEHIALMSTPCILVKALEVTQEKSDKVWNFLYDNVSTDS